MSGPKDRAPRVVGPKTNIERIGLGAPATALAAMQLRFEEAGRLYTELERAQPKLSDDHTDEQFRQHFGCADAMSALDAERDALQRAILYQIPANDEELAVLLFHVSLLNESQSEYERGVCEVALHAIVNYVVGSRSGEGPLCEGESLAQFESISQAKIGYRTATPEWLA